jgi:hypothetical protein
MLVQLVCWNCEKSYPSSLLDYVEGCVCVEEVGSSIFLASSSEAVVVLTIVWIIGQVDSSYYCFLKMPPSSELLKNRIVCADEHTVSLSAVKLLQPVEKGVCRRRIFWSCSHQIFES